MDENSKKIWTTWDKREILISEMETKHIKNATHKIERMVAQKYRLRQGDTTIQKLAAQDFPEYVYLTEEFILRENKKVKSALADQLAVLRNKNAIK